MGTWKCLAARAPFAPLTLSLALALLPATARADRGKTPILPPDAAARAFEAGRDAVRKGDYASGVKRLEEALATGHTRPEEHLGTTRNFVDRYDPDYWLGVAYMELGQKEKAKTHLLRSKTNGAIARWPEFADLTTRLASLEEPVKPVAALAPQEPTHPPEEPPRTPPLPTPQPSPTAKPLPIPPLPVTPVPVLAMATPVARPRLDATELASLLSLLSRAEWSAF
jgi:hypothetical protein